MRCRVLERAATELRRTRLGQVERGVLLVATPPEPEAEWPYPSPAARITPRVVPTALAMSTSVASAEEKVREAIRRLRDKGLMRSTALHRSGRPPALLTWATPLGQAVRVTYDDELSSRRPIRWKVPERLAAPSRLPTERLQKILAERQQRALELVPADIEERLAGIDWATVARVKAVRLRSLDEVDERFSERINQAWGHCGPDSRSSTVTEAAKLRAAARRQRLQAPRR
jgi:hypothetical protein